jgi:hypothetical protein
MSILDVQRYTNWFYEQTNTCSADGGEQVALGITRMGEVDIFVDRVMVDWTQKADMQYSGLMQGLTPQQMIHYFENRFCTYAEYLSLSDKIQQRKQIWKEALFTFLGMNDEQKQNLFYERFTPDRTSYFNLMAMVFPQMRTFFFPSLSCKYSIS